MNNPLKYTDPDGEWIHLAIGAFIGGTTNLMMNSDNIDNFWEGLGYFGVGAAAGTVGGIAGQAVAGAVGTVGFAGGALTGGAAGFSGGFVAGSGNAWMGGASFGSGLKSGLRTGAIGGVTGGIIGGISGGITAVEHGGDFWTGDGAKFDALATPIKDKKITLGDEMDYSNKYAQNFSDQYFGKNVKGVNDLYANGSLPNGYTTRGDIVLNPQGNPVRGTTVFLGTGNGSDVYLYKAAFTSKERLYLTMGHEYLHAGYFSTGLMNTKSQHASIYKWEAYQAKAWGFEESYYAHRYFSYKNYYKSSYDFNNLGFYVLSITPW
jgi:hypothetical protein